MKLKEFSIWLSLLCLLGVSGFANHHEAYTSEASAHPSHTDPMEDSETLNPISTGPADDVEEKDTADAKSDDDRSFSELWDDFGETLRKWKESGSEQWKEKTEVLEEKFNGMTERVNEWLFQPEPIEDLEFKHKSERALDDLNARLTRVERRFERLDNPMTDEQERQLETIEALIMSADRIQKETRMLRGENRDAHVEFFWSTVDEINGELADIRKDIPRDWEEVKEEAEMHLEQLKERVDRVDEELARQEDLEDLREDLEQNIQSVEKKLSELTEHVEDEAEDAGESLQEVLDRADTILR